MLRNFWPHHVVFTKNIEILNESYLKSLMEQSLESAIPPPETYNSIFFLFDMDGKVYFWYYKTKAAEAWVKKSTKQ